MAWQEDKANRCPGCGLPRDECMAQGSSYTATAWRCFACEARESAAARFSKDKNSSTAGLQFAVERDERGD